MERCHLTGAASKSDSSPCPASPVRQTEGISPFLGQIVAFCSAARSLGVKWAQQSPPLPSGKSATSATLGGKGGKGSVDRWRCYATGGGDGTSGRPAWGSAHRKIACGHHSSGFHAPFKAIGPRIPTPTASGKCRKGTPERCKEHARHVAPWRALNRTRQAKGAGRHSVRLGRPSRRTSAPLIPFGPRSKRHSLRLWRTGTARRAGQY